MLQRSPPIPPSSAAAHPSAAPAARAEPPPPPPLHPRPAAAPAQPAAAVARPAAAAGQLPRHPPPCITGEGERARKPIAFKGGTASQRKQGCRRGSGHKQRPLRLPGDTSAAGGAPALRPPLTRCRWSGAGCVPPSAPAPRQRHPPAASRLLPRRRAARPPPPRGRPPHPSARSREARSGSWGRRAKGAAAVKERASSEDCPGHAPLPCTALAPNCNNDTHGDRSRGPAPRRPLVAKACPPHRARAPAPPPA